MTPEKLLTAINEIDNRFIQEAHSERPGLRRVTGRRIAAIAAAVIALAAMTATAFAADEIAGWLQHYFTQKSETGLTTKQIEYIEENECLIAETQVQNGYAVELQSSMTSGDTTYVTLVVTAPEGINLEEMVLEPFDGFEITNDQGQPPFCWGFNVQEDPDGLANTAHIVIDIEPGQWNTQYAWHIQIDRLYRCTYDKAYEQELLNTKYAGQNGFIVTSDEAELLNLYSVLAEGPWEFSVCLDSSDTRELELLTQPVTVQALVTRRGSDDITSEHYFLDSIEDVTVTSVVLTSLDMSIYYDCDASVRFTDNNERCVYAVMKDGSRIRLTMGNGVSLGRDTLLAESPIILDDVDYVLLADGTMLMAP